MRVSNGGATAIVVVIILLLSAAVGAFCWTYSINQWLQVFGKEPIIEWWQGMLIGFVPYIGQFSVPVAVLTWIASLIFM